MRAKPSHEQRRMGGGEGEGGGEAGGLYAILLWVPLAPIQYWPTGGLVALQFHGLAFKGSKNVVWFGTLLAGSKIGRRSGQLSW